MLTCKYCKKKWQRKYNLEKHQKTAKYCLEIQKNLVKKNKSKRNKGKSKISNKTEQFRTINSNDDKDDSKIICGHCGKIFTGKFAVYNSMKHDKKCIYEKMQQKIAEQSSKILTLQQKIDEMTMAAINRPTNQTVINQKIQNLIPLDMTEMTEQSRYLTIDHIKNGAAGYAKFALEYPLKDRIVCVDYARRKIKFKNEVGELITDPDMANTAINFFQSIKDKNEDLISKYSNELTTNFGENGDRIVELLSYKEEVENLASGQKDDFHSDFVKECCSLSST